MSADVGLLDTGPLIAFLLPALPEHRWVVEQWKRFTPPLHTCEAVLSEAAFLLHREGHPADALFDLIECGGVRVGISVENERVQLRALMHRYCNRPMSLADACLVRLSEKHANSVVLTFDSDFRIYRRHGNKVIPVRMPESGN